MQPRHQATLTQPLQCDLQTLNCKHTKNYAQRRRKLQLQNRISTPKRKKDDFEALFKRTFTKENYQRQNWENLLTNHCRSLDAATPIRFTMSSCKRQVVLRMQPRHQATLTQPLQCVLQHHVANLHVSTHMATPDDNNHAAIPMRSATTDSRNA